MTLLLTLFYGAWLFLAVAVHASRRFADRARRHDRWSLIPVWRFFVANAMRQEFFVVSSTREANLAPADWLLPPPHSRASWRPLFNPARLDSKAFNDAVYFVIQAKDPTVRRILIHWLAKLTDPSGPGAWTILRKDNLRGDFVVADTLP